MDAKISPSFWADLDGLPPEVKLTMLWCITNAETSANLLGVFTWRPRRFEFDTGLDAEWFTKTRTAMPRAFAIEGDRVLLTHYLAYQFGRGERLVKNNVAKGLIKPFGGLPKGLQALILELYNELTPILCGLKPFQALAKPLPSPSKPLSELATEGLTNTALTPKESSEGLPGEALRRGREEKSSTEKSTSGESEGGGAVVPAEAEVLAFGRDWPGDMVRGIPARMPEGWVLSWLAWRMGDSAPPFPRDWQSDLVRRFTADWVKKRGDTRHAATSTNGSPDVPHDRGDLEAELLKSKDPVKRRSILERLKAVPA